MRDEALSKLTGIADCIFVRKCLCCDFVSLLIAFDDDSTPHTRCEWIYWREQDIRGCTRDGSSRTWHGQVLLNRNLPLPPKEKRNPQYFHMNRHVSPLSFLPIFPFPMFLISPRWRRMNLAMRYTLRKTWRPNFVRFYCFRWALILRNQSGISILFYSLRLFSNPYHIILSLFFRIRFSRFLVHFENKYSSVLFSTECIPPASSSKKKEGKGERVLFQVLRS